MQRSLIPTCLALALFSGLCTPACLQLFKDTMLLPSTGLLCPRPSVAFLPQPLILYLTQLAFTQPSTCSWRVDFSREVIWNLLLVLVILSPQSRKVSTAECDHETGIFCFKDAFLDVGVRCPFTQPVTISLLLVKSRGYV